MSVGADDEHHVTVPRPTQDLGRSIESMEMTIDLDPTAGLLGGTENGIDVEGDSGTPSD